MAKTTFDIKSLELPAPVARPLYAGVGATDLAVTYVRETVADVQKRFAGVQKDVQTRVAGVQKNVKDIELEPKALRQQATTVVGSRVDALAKDAKARRAAVEARVADLQADARAQAATVVGTYAELAQRGEDTLKRLRGEAAGTLDTAANTVDAPKTATATQSAARRSTSKKPAAKKTTANKSTAKKSTAKSTTK